MYDLNPELGKLARACATRRVFNRDPRAGLYFGAGCKYQHALGANGQTIVPVFVIITPEFRRTYGGMV